MLQPATRRSYRRSWLRFKAFLVSIGRDNVPVTAGTLSLYMGYLSECGFAPNSVNVALSAIGFVHKWGGHSDPTCGFRVRALQRGLSKRSRPDTRQALSIGALERMVAMLGAHDERVMLTCLFSLAFYGLCRLGELVGSGPHVLVRGDVTLGDGVVNLRFRTYKHSRAVASVSLEAKPGSVLCPVTCVRNYLAIRGPACMLCLAFFVCKSGKAVGFGTVSKMVRDLGQRLSPPLVVGGHSFRIGGATQAAAMGRSDSEIRRLGRWQSSAFLRYLRGAVSN